MIKIKQAARNAAQRGIDLSILQREEGIVDGRNLGGKFRLPAEFDTATMASGFYKEGSEVEGRKQREIISGTQFSADGWNVWLFPEDHPDPECAGKPYKVSSDGATYILMSRPLEVQEAVNFIHGESSRDRMNAEVHGETVGGNSPDDQGVLTAERLAQDPSMRSEITRDREQGRDVGAFTGQRPTSKHITKKKIKLRK